MADARRVIQDAMEQARSGDPRRAIAALERLVQKKGAPAEAYHFLGMLLNQAGRSEHAVFHLERASRMEPGRAQFESNFANVLAGAGRVEEAQRRYGMALQAEPQYVPAIIGLAGLCLNTGRLSDAHQHASRAAELAPDSPDAVGNLASVLILTGRAGEAARLLHGTVARVGPSIQLGTLLAAARNYDADSTPEQILDVHRTLGHLHGAAARQFAASLPPLKKLSPGTERLRVGYLSADFRDHPVGMFISPALASDDEVEVLCYDLTPNPDAATDAMRARNVTWREARALGPAALAAAVRADALDVLVELGGHTIGNRQTALAARMAPVQITYLGYPATTGNPAIDARLVDSRSDPPGADQWVTERLIRLDHCAWCYTAPPGAPDIPPLPAGDDAPITFGSFNNLAKTVPAVLDAWASLLRRIERSRLVLKNASFIDGPTRDATVAEFTGRGIDADRVETVAPAADPLGHLAAYARIDIALDTFPYAGTTTTCEALWMGVPVVTLAGRLHAGRVGASLLGSLGLDDLVARDAESYLEIAATLAADRPRLVELRRTRRERMRASPLMDQSAFRARLHGAYAALVRERAGGAG